MLTQYIFEEDELKSPFIMSYIGISSMIIAFPIHRLSVHRARKEKSKQAQVDALLEAESFDSFADDLSRYQNYSDLGDIFARRAMCLVYDHDRTWNHRKHIMAAFLITPAMLLADWAFNAALLSTSIASATTLVSISSMFVYIMALALSLDFFSLLKMVGILLGVAGMALTAVHDGNSDKATNSNYAISDVITYTYNSTTTTPAFEFPDTGMFGDVLAVMAAVAYATYTIQVRLFCPENEDLYSMNLLLGYIGLLAFIPLFPVAAWLFISGQIRMSWSTFGLVMCKGFLDFLVTDYLLFRAIILMGPTAATVGSGMSIPIAFLGDLAMSRKDVFSLYSIVGAVACSAGFLVVNLAPSNEAGNGEISDDPSGLRAESKENPILTNDHTVV
jgi:solute carrier family 35 protein F5